MANFECRLLLDHQLDAQVIQTCKWTSTNSITPSSLYSSILRHYPVAWPETAQTQPTTPNNLNHAIHRRRHLQDYLGAYTLTRGCARTAMPACPCPRLLCLDGLLVMETSGRGQRRRGWTRARTVIRIRRDRRTTELTCAVPLIHTRPSYCKCTHRFNWTCITQADCVSNLALDAAHLLESSSSEDAVLIVGDFAK